jgi:hypothetical protein
MLSVDIFIQKFYNNQTVLLAELLGSVFCLLIRLRYVF